MGCANRYVQVPAGVSAEDVQELINQHLLDAEVDGETTFEGGIYQKGKMILRKRMDIRTWKRVFQDGDLVKRRMLRCASMVFARYFFIPDEENVNIIQVVCTDTYGDKFKVSEPIKGVILGGYLSSKTNGCGSTIRSQMVIYMLFEPLERGIVIGLACSIRR